MSKYINHEAMIKDVLRVNYLNIQTEKSNGDWVNITVLGKGNFGVVFKVYEKSTKSSYAVKYINPKKKSLVLENLSQLLVYLNERNYLLRARDSVMITKFYSSFQLPYINGYFLCFEFCLLDLNKLLSGLDQDRFNIDEIIINKSKTFSIDNEAKQITKQYKIANFLDILKVYTFECFCMLDFLAENQIVHRDIKPDNIMIAENFHLKLADFGLVYNTTFLTDKTKTKLVKHSEIDQVLSSRGGFICGTNRYLDMETLLIKFIKANKYNQVPLKIIPEGIENSDCDMNFLSDLWAMAITILELLTLENDFLRPHELTEKQMESIEIKYTRDPLLDFSQFFLNEYTWKTFIQDGIRFLRCPDFLKSKKILFFETTKSIKYIDVNTVEQMAIYDKLNLNRSNVFLYRIPEAMGQLKSFLNKAKKKVDFPDMKSFIDHLKNEEIKSKSSRLLNIGSQANITLI